MRDTSQDSAVDIRMSFKVDSQNSDIEEISSLIEEWVDELDLRTAYPEFLYVWQDSGSSHDLHPSIRIALPNFLPDASNVSCLLQINQNRGTSLSK